MIGLDRFEHAWIGLDRFRKVNELVWLLFNSAQVNGGTSGPVKQTGSTDRHRGKQNFFFLSLKAI